MYVPLLDLIAETIYLVEYAFVTAMPVDKNILPRYFLYEINGSNLTVNANAKSLIYIVSGNSFHSQSYYLQNIKKKIVIWKKNNNLIAFIKIWLPNGRVDITHGKEHAMYIRVVLKNKLMLLWRKINFLVKELVAVIFKSFYRLTIVD